MGKRIYSDEFMAEGMRKAGEPGVTVAHVAREIGGKRQTPHRWK